MGAIVIKDRVKFFSILLNVVLLCIIFGVWKHGCPPCYEAGQTVTKTEIIRPKDTTPKVISVSVPVAVKSIPKKQFRKAAVKKSLTVDTSHFRGEIAEADGCHESIASLPSPCDTINIYSDTISKPDDYKLVINDTTEGRIIGRSVLFVNLKPEIVTTITHVKKEKWKVYLGLGGTYNNRYIDRWGLGPKAAITIPKIGAFDYYYDSKNNSHTLGALALIRFAR